MNFALGLIVGFASGGVIAYWLGRRSTADATTIAESLAAKIFAKHTDQILSLAESKLSGKKDVIDGTLKAMKSDLNRVEELMNKVKDGNVKVDTRLNDAAKVMKQLSESTGDLKNALSSNSMRGQWGERMAEDVLRLSGLVEGINFHKQTMLGTGSKPDFTFILPQQQKLNMDVKFPFNNYQLYTEATTESEKEQYKDRFLKDVRKRLKEVQTRDYINPEDGTVDYVLLFVPNEQVFGFINEFDRALIDEALRGKTILCSPLSLYAILAIIRQSMDNFSMETTSREMLTVFGAFKLQWEKFKDQMETVKQRFETVHKGYEELIGARENQLDRQLDKLERLRTNQAVELPKLEQAIETAKVNATKRMTSKTPEEAML